MVREKAEKSGHKYAATLVLHGVPKEFAKRVGRTYDKDGPGSAMLELYAGGWEVCVLWDRGVQKLYISRCLGMTDKQIDLIEGGNGGKGKGQEEGW